MSVVMVVRSDPAASVGRAVLFIVAAAIFLALAARTFRAVGETTNTARSSETRMSEPHVTPSSSHAMSSQAEIPDRPLPFRRSGTGSPKGPIKAPQ
jgi:hypothetical protein